MSDIVNLILTAMGGAFVTGSQTVLSDTIKDELEALVTHIRQVFTKKENAQQSLMVLDAYCEAPDIWEKPMQAALTKEGFAQDTAAQAMAQQLLASLQAQAGASSLVHVQHTGNAYGSVNGINLGIIVNNTHTREDKATDGKRELQEGQDALQRGDFDAAISHLEKSLSTLSEKQYPVESAHARALLALALFGVKRPRQVTYQTFCRATQLIQAAITLHSSWAYLYTLAIIKQDYARNGHSQLYGEANQLIKQVNKISFTTQDEAYIDILRHCQSPLLKDAETWWN